MVRRLIRFYNYRVGLVIALGILANVFTYDVGRAQETPYVTAYIDGLGDNGSVRRIDTFLEEIPIRGTVVFDPAIMDYYKLEIKGGGRSFIGSDLFERTPANDWVTLGEIRTDTVIDGVLGTIPSYPTLSPGGWQLRLVVVGLDGQTFVANETISFRVNVPDDDPVRIEISQPAPHQILHERTPIWGTIETMWAASSYKFEIRGGQFTDWTTIDAEHRNDPANPTRIYNGLLGHIPGPEALLPGHYELRLVVQCGAVVCAGEFLQAPTIIPFEIPGMPSYELISPANDSVITAPTPIIGTVQMNDAVDFYKLEYARINRRGQVQSEWVSIGDIRRDSVIQGQLGTFPGPDSLERGSYRLRLVIVGVSGQYLADLFQVDLRVRRP